jgi:hypothetical protein
MIWIYIGSSHGVLPFWFYLTLFSFSCNHYLYQKKDFNKVNIKVYRTSVDELLQCHQLKWNSNRKEIPVGSRHLSTWHYFVNCFQHDWDQLRFCSGIELDPYISDSATVLITCSSDAQQKRGLCNHCKSTKDATNGINRQRHKLTAAATNTNQ